VLVVVVDLALFWLVGVCSSSWCWCLVGVLELSAMTSKEERDRLGKKLWDAANRGDQHQVALALDQGASIEWRNTNSKGDTPLIVSSRHGHESVVRLLLERRASIDAVQKDNATSLHLAASNGHESVARLLLERGASIDAATKNNLTSLHIAASKGHASVVRLLLERGADTTVVSVRRTRSLMLITPNRHSLTRFFDRLTHKHQEQQHKSPRHHRSSN